MSTSSLRRNRRQQHAEKNIFRLKSSMPKKFEEILLKHLANVTEIKIQELSSEQRGKTQEKVTLRRKSSISLNIRPFKKKEVTQLTSENISILIDLMEFIGRSNSITNEGLFRKIGNLERQKILRKHITENSAVDFENLTPHDCANVLKKFIRDLPEPLLTNGFRNVYIRLASAITASDKSKTAITRALQLLMLLLPDNNYCLLKPLMALLHRTAKVKENLMTANSLALMFTPHFLCSKLLSGTELQTITNTFSDLVAFMIEAGKEVFKVPQDLADEVSNFWKEMEIPNYLYFQSVTKKNFPLKSLNDSVLADSLTTPKKIRSRSPVHVIDLGISPDKRRRGLFLARRRINSANSETCRAENRPLLDILSTSYDDVTVNNVIDPGNFRNKRRSKLFSSRRRKQIDTSDACVSVNRPLPVITTTKIDDGDEADNTSEQPLFNFKLVAVIDKPVAVVKPITRSSISQIFCSAPQQIQKAMQTPRSRAPIQVQSPEQISTDTFGSFEVITV